MKLAKLGLFLSIIEFLLCLTLVIVLSYNTIKSQANDDVNTSELYCYYISYVNAYEPIYQVLSVFPEDVTEWNDDMIIHYGLLVEHVKERRKYLEEAIKTRYSSDAYIPSVIFEMLTEKYGKVK